MASAAPSASGSNDNPSVPYSEAGLDRDTVLKLHGYLKSPDPKLKNYVFLMK